MKPNGEGETCKRWVWPWAFLLKRMLPLPQSGCTCKEWDRQQCFSEGCVLFHINDKETSGRSHYHSPFCLKRTSFTIQSAGVPRNPVKAGGCLKDKRQKQPDFLSVKQGLLVIHQNQLYLCALQWGLPA